MSTYPFKEELRVPRLVLIVTICLVALSIAGQVRSMYVHIGEEIPQTRGASLSVLSTPSKAKGEEIPTPYELASVKGEEIPTPLQPRLA